jgi:hypothetical protein
MPNILSPDMVLSRERGVCGLGLASGEGRYLAADICRDIRAKLNDVRMNRDRDECVDRFIFLFTITRLNN